MNKLSRVQISAAAVITAALLIGGCATKAGPYTQYDFGPLPNAAANSSGTALPAVSLGEVKAPAWLDNTMMMVRLGYATDFQPRPYATTRWPMPPAQLFSQRLKARIGQAGGTVVSVSDGATNIPVLRIEMDDFSQTFDNASHSVAQLTIRASLFNGRSLLAPQTFSRQVASPTADAAGGARAFSIANDALIDDLIGWLASLPQKK